MWLRQDWKTGPLNGWAQGLIPWAAQKGSYTAHSFSLSRSSHFWEPVLRNPFEIQRNLWGPTLFLTTKRKQPKHPEAYAIASKHMSHGLTGWWKQSLEANEGWKHTKMTSCFWCCPKTLPPWRGPSKSVCKRDNVMRCCGPEQGTGIPDFLTSLLWVLVSLV